MPENTIHMMIGKAVTDRRFREHLLRSPREATREFPLTNHERELIASVEAASLEEFSCRLRERLPEFCDSERNPRAYGQT